MRLPLRVRDARVVARGSKYSMRDPRGGRGTGGVGEPAGSDASPISFVRWNGLSPRQAGCFSRAPSFIEQASSECLGREPEIACGLQGM